MLEEVCAFGRDPMYICQKSQTKSDQPAPTAVLKATHAVNTSNNGASSDDDDDEDDVASTHSGTAAVSKQTTVSASSSNTDQQ